MGLCFPICADVNPQNQTGAVLRFRRLRPEREPGNHLRFVLATSFPEAETDSTDF